MQQSFLFKAMEFTTCLPYCQNRAHFKPFAVNRLHVISVNQCKDLVNEGGGCALREERCALREEEREGGCVLREAEREGGEGRRVCIEGGGEGRRRGKEGREGGEGVH